MSSVVSNTFRKQLPPPSVPLTNPKFQYVPADKTDVRKTFERARAQYNLK